MKKNQYSSLLLHVTLGYRIPVTWPFLNPMATASANGAAGNTQAAVAANFLSHQQASAQQSVPASSHMSPAAASLLLAQRSAVQRRRYLGWACGLFMLHWSELIL